MCIFNKKLKEAQATIDDLRRQLRESEEKLKLKDDIIERDDNIKKAQQKRIDKQQHIIDGLNNGSIRQRSRYRREDHNPYPEE